MPGRRTVLKGLALTAFAPVGCLRKQFTHAPEAAKPVPHGRLVSTWEKRVVYAPDASRGGAIIPGLIGRMYLFGPDQTVPQMGDGSVKLDLWDSTPNGDTPPKQLEHFIVPADVLKMFAKKDGLDFDSYTLFFPWPTYRTDVSQVYITMLYTSAAGENYFHQSGTFAIDHADSHERIKKGMSISSTGLNQVSSK